MSDPLTYTKLSECLGSSFQVLGAFDPPVALELIEVERLPHSNHSPNSKVRQEPFSLLFRGPLDPYFPQQIFQFEHPALGQVSFFLVPIGQQEDGFRYEAIFN